MGEQAERQMEAAPGQTYGGKVSGRYLQFVLLLLGDLGEQFGFLSGQRIDQRITLRHQTGLKLHAALLQHASSTRMFTSLAALLLCVC